MSCLDLETNRRGTDKLADKPSDRQTNKQGGEQTVKQADKQKVKQTDSKLLGGLKILDTQVAGHRFGEDDRKLGMLDRGDGTVLKAIQGPPRGPREENFYKTVFDAQCQDPVVLKLRPFLPWYYGTEHREGVDFLVLQNVTHRLEKPNVLDLKMGRVTYDPLASPEKIQHETKKFPPLTKLGFQIIGMMTQNLETGTTEKMPKSYLRGLTENTMLTQGLGRFFGLNRGGLRKDVIKALLAKLGDIERWFLDERKFSFYSSSILVVYDSVKHGSHNQTQPSTATSTSPSTSSSTPITSGSKNARRDDTADDTDDGEDGVPCKRRKVDNSAASVSRRRSKEISSGGNKGTSDIPGQRDSTQNQSSSETCKTNAGECSDTNTDPGNLELSKKNSEEIDTLKEKMDPATQPKMATLASGDSKLVGQRPSRDSVSTLASGHCSSRDSVFSVPIGSSPPRDDDEVPLVEVRMIDFAHVFPSDCQDENYLFGLQKLISHLEQLLSM